MQAEDKNVVVGVIGGSGMYHLDNLNFVRGDTLHLQSPSASSSSVPSRANIAALKSLGVRVILAFSAVGSLREDIPPGTFALPSQIIDRTKGIRPATFFDGSVVAHTSFGDPISPKLGKWLEKAVTSTLSSASKKEGNNDSAEEVKLVTNKCIVCMEGPQFSTRAESLMYRQWGGDLINMSVLPEAKLAKEAEISYGLIATGTDYDSWRLESEAITTADVFKTLQDNANRSRLVAASVLDELSIAASQGDILSMEVGSMKLSIMPRSENQKEEDREKLRYILPEYFSD
ncbi:purine and uridine phosphorylase [Gymnopus androsaceus JB14]|uniref:Purine nucleoside phosphorylase n=1 Tax=Gymnopus androsaceus JB14 TaxID=1447944 RepID=A0A6A4HRW1_9AGAR|nr:purine and uridine phosphorylase [Gymnopus androsaceus JB14]